MLEQSPAPRLTSVLMRQTKSPAPSSTSVLLLSSSIVIGVNRSFGRSNKVSSFALDFCSQLRYKYRSILPTRQSTSQQLIIVLASTARYPPSNSEIQIRQRITSRIPPSNSEIQIGRRITSRPVPNHCCRMLMPACDLLSSRSRGWSICSAIYPKQPWSLPPCLDQHSTQTRLMLEAFVIDSAPLALHLYLRRR